MCERERERERERESLCVCVLKVIVSLINNTNTKYIILKRGGGGGGGTRVRTSAHRVGKGVCSFILFGQTVLLFVDSTNKGVHWHSTEVT